MHRLNFCIAIGMVILCCLILSQAAHGQSTGPRRLYTTDDGLLSNNIQALAYREDQLTWPPCDPATSDFECPVIPGVWVGTDEGVNYINGRDAISFVDNLPHKDVRTLLFASDGKLWIGTAGGLTWLDEGAENREGDNDNQFRTPTIRSDDRWRDTPLLPERQIAVLAQTSDGAR